MVLVYRILSKFAFQLSNSFQEIWTFAKQKIWVITQLRGLGSPLSQHPMS